MCVCALCGSYSELAFHCMPNAQHGLAPKTALSRAQLQALLPVPQTSWLSAVYACWPPALQPSLDSSCQASLQRGRGVFSISCLLSRASQLSSSLTLDLQLCQDTVSITPPGKCHGANFPSWGPLPTSTAAVLNLPALLPRDPHPYRKLTLVRI